MRYDKLLIGSILVGLFLIVSSIIVFGTPDFLIGNVGISQPANNTYTVIAGTYTFKGSLAAPNSTDNVTWFYQKNGTGAAVLIGINTTGNGTHFTNLTSGIGNGNFSITASFNATNLTAIHYSANITHHRIIVDNTAPIISRVLLNYSSTNGSASNTALVKESAANGICFNNTGTLQMIVEVANADLSNNTYLHALANTTLFYKLNKSSVGTSRAGFGKVPESVAFTGASGPGNGTSPKNLNVNYTILVDVSNMSEGNYSLTLFVADNSTSDVNNSVYSKFNYSVANIMIDKTPSITMSRETTASTTDVFGTVKYKCTVNDGFNGGTTNTIKLTKPSGTSVSESFGSGTDHSFSGTDTNEAGTYTVKCTTTESGYGKLSASTSATFTVYHGGGGTSAGAGGGGSSSGTISGGLFVNLDLTTGDGSGSLSGNQGTTKSFSVDGETKHTIEFTTVGETLVTLTISSDPVKVQLNVGDSKKVDVDNDGVNDLKVTLDGITNGKADVTLNKVTEAVEDDEVVTEDEEVTPGAEEEAEVTEEAKGIGTGIIITVIVVIVVIILAFLLLRKKK